MNIFELIEMVPYSGPFLDLKYFDYKFSIEDDFTPNGACREVKFLYVIDGDTIAISYNKKVYRIRLLVIDTPETVDRIDKWGKEATLFTKELILKSSRIVLQLDNKSEKLFDNYNRLLAWVWLFIDNQYCLLNSMLVSNGLALVKYIDHPEIMYLDILRKQEEVAKISNLLIHNKGIEKENLL